MQSRNVIIALIALTGLASVSFAQNPVDEPRTRKPMATAGDPNKVSFPPFPYIAEITGDRVNIRCGPGTQYYPCGKLNGGDRVKVVNHQPGWSCIVPPAGSFSWISTQYVRIDPNNPMIGTVTGDNVRVWVGAEGLRPMYSTTWRLKLNRGEKVQLFGVEQDKYYKIAPPTGAYRWVSTEYTKPLGTAGQVAPPIGISEPDRGTPLSLEAAKLKEYYALQEQVEAERTKPVDQQDPQNYRNLKKGFLEISQSKDAGKAARYAEFALNQISRYELALEVAKAVRLQDVQLQQDLQRIENAFAARLAEMQDLGRFAVVGQFQTSSVFRSGPEIIHYRIVDRSGKAVCYTLPTGSASRMDLSRLVGRQVGLVGTIEPHPPTKGALVRFSEIVEVR